MRKYSTDLTPVADIRELIISRAATAGDRLAFAERLSRDELREISFTAFAADVAALGTELLARNRATPPAAARQPHIAVIGENSCAWVTACFAAICSGFVAVPLDNSLGAGQLAEQLAHSDSDCLFCSRAHFEALQALPSPPGIPLYPLDELEPLIASGRAAIAAGDSSYSEVEVHPRQMAAIFYTSGTTGNSKGVMLSHANITAVVNANREKYIAHGATLAVLPFHHAYGFVVAILMVYNEGHSVFINAGLHSILHDLRAARPTAMAVVPLFIELFHRRIMDTVRRQGRERSLAFALGLSRFLRFLKIDLRRRLFAAIHRQFGGRLVDLICGGAPMDPEHVRFFDQIGINVINGYGITECAPVVAVDDKYSPRPGTTGTPLSCCRVRIAADGEIMVSGESVFQGYYRDEEATEASLVNGEFATGDLGSLDAGGYLTITGRKKNLIILANGENVSPEEIEMELARDSAVQEVLVVEQDRRIVAYIFPTEAFLGNTEHFRTLRRVYNAAAQPAKRIAEIVLRDCEFEKNSARKILRHKALQPAP